MPKPSKEDQAIALLESAARNEKLSEDQFLRIASLFVLAGRTRTKMRGALSIAENTTPEGALSVAGNEILDGALSIADNTTPEDALFIAENTILGDYVQQYDRLSQEIKRRCDWKTISTRLLKNGGKKLRKAKAMQGGGELVGIDVKGRAMFKDKGVEPVMYGFDKEDRLTRICDRDPEQMAKVTLWANYFEIRKQVRADGYELFGYDVEHGLTDEMEQVQIHTKEPFVASKYRKEHRASWLESGARPGYDTHYASFFEGSVCVYNCLPKERSVEYGVVRLLRV
jgi:hypothetical protein